MKILDSDHCIAILRGKLDLHTRVPSNEILAVTTISVGELTHGAHKSTRAPENLAKLDILLGHLLVLSFEEPAARKFGEMKAALERAGTVIGDLDMQIASVALTNDAMLLTHNQRRFERVSDLLLGDWIE